MAGTVPDFPAEEVRAGLRLAMSIGLPQLEAEKPAFHMPRTSVVVTPGATASRVDESGTPYDPAARRSKSGAPDVRKVPCGIEYFDNTGKIENFGVIVPSKVQLTLLDEDYDQVKGFEFVVIGGSRFFYSKTETPSGLDVITVYTVHAVAEDQM